jgi:hypothetical protein
MAADPVHRDGQTVPVQMPAFLRHISIMHPLSLGWRLELDDHVARLGAADRRRLAGRFRRWRTCLWA